MNNSHLMHVVDGVKKLRDEKSASVFAHGAHCLTQVEEKATRDILHGDVDQVGDSSARRLDNFATVSKALHGDHVLMVHVLQNSDFIVDRLDGLPVTAQKFFFQYLDGDKGATVLK